MNVNNELRNIAIEGLAERIHVYQLNIINSTSEIVELENSKINIIISCFVRDFAFVVRAIKTQKEISLVQLILKKYPNYYQPSSKDIVFAKKASDFIYSFDHLKYLVKTSFDFIEENFPEVLQGQF